MRESDLGLQGIKWAVGRGTRCVLARGADEKKLTRSGEVSKMVRFDFQMWRPGRTRAVGVSWSCLGVARAGALPTDIH